MTRRALLVAAALACVQDVALAVSYTTCKDPSVTWYNNKDGLNPCQQYEALRRICDSTFEVPQLSVNTPGDNCNSQLSACCCNSISFTLSMLCLQCQQGVGTGRAPDTGIDAGDGAYQMYLGGCGPVSNKSLPATTQLAVCREGPSLKKWMYDLFWTDGPWFLEFTRQTANLQAASGTDDPGRCGTLGTTTASTISRSTENPPSSTGSNTDAPGTGGGGKSDSVNAPGPGANGGGGGGGNNTAVILGATLGAAVAVILLIALSCYLVRRRRRAEARPENMYESRPYNGAATMASVVPIPPAGSEYAYSGYASEAGTQSVYQPGPATMRSTQARRETVPPSYYDAASSSQIPPSVPTSYSQGSQVWSSPGQSGSLLAHQSTPDVLQSRASPPPEVQPYLLMSGGPPTNDRKVSARPPPAYENS
ncbi:hypothetical protein AURDEDRAFT_112257 [Auricularia subglabra TFB-10046 SS5]|nr:hypothetical protein AURDEDRAFT_112257 [Auricularia subglabra TFB-10046 SS5]